MKNANRIDYRKNDPQTVNGIGGTQVFELFGHCSVCHGRIYAGVNETGGHYDPDPRGFIDEAHARVTLTPDRTGYAGVVYTCYSCSNDAEKYKLACELAKLQGEAAREAVDRYLKGE